MGILAWIVLGLVAGTIARLLVPGKQPGGCVTTIALGVVGALIGGYIGSILTGEGISGINNWSVFLAIVGSVILIFVWSRLFGKS
ncbi:MAG: GlsB/YeaQ/YmgE family stress response membrane protein [Candidatus Aquicultor sp.]|nr:GlsB/YeaQ/YmgE family stress response membrane protein [Candidatus Aquicultor sp.]